MALSFSDSLKKHTESIDNQTKLMTAKSESAVADIPLMTLEEDYGFEVYSGDDGSWQQHADYVRYYNLSDDNISTINDRKEITLNDKQINITQEENSQYIPFEMNRYYDGYDLVNAVISIHYETKTGVHGASKAVNVTFNNNKIRFGWLVDAGATLDAGTLAFEIHAYGSITGSDGVAKGYVWKTKSNKNINVLQSICDCEEVTNHIDDSWVQELVTNIAQKVADEIKDVAVGEQVEAARDAAAKAEQHENNAKQYADNAASAATEAVNTVLADYATTDYVDEAVAGVDVTEQLASYVKTSDLEANYYTRTDTEQRVSNILEGYATKDDVANAIDSAELDNYYKKDETYSSAEIDEKLGSVTVDLTGYATESYVDNKTGILSGKIDDNTKNIGTINAKLITINNTLDSIDKSPNAQYITTYNQPFTFEGEEYTGENMLVLYEIYNKDKENETRTVVSSHEIKGGSGAAVSSSKVERITSTPFIERFGNKVVLHYNFINDDTGVGYATWKIGNRTIINKKTIYSGENFEDLTDYIGTGSDQKVSLIVTDDANTILTLVWYVSIVDIKLTSNFDDTRYYAAGSPVDFTFTPSGAVDKTIHFLLDGKEIGTKTSIKSASDLLDSYTIPAQEHGSHLIEAYVTATINNINIGDDRSIYVAKDIVWFDSESDIPVIGCATPVINTMQYNTVKIKYTVFDKNTETPEVTWYVNGDATSSEVLTEKDEDGYYIKSYRANDVGTFELKVTCGEAEPKIITLNVEELNIDVTPVTTGLAFDFNPSGYSNSSPDRLWTNGTVSMSVSPNFDWVNGGYQYDENGDQYFCVKSGTTATIDYNLFADDAKTQGKEFKVVFKTSNIKNRNTSFISCMNSGIGLDMKVQDANIYSSNGSLYSPYCEEDVIEFEFNINTIDNIPLVMTYEDGVGCRPMIYASDASFWQTTAQPITIGSTDCDVYIYRMKAYTRSLSDSEILSNFILDARNSNEIANRYNKNKIYESVDENGKKILSIRGTLTPEGLAKACPDLRIIIVDAPWFTNDKDNKVDDTTITMIYENGRPEDNWTCTGAKHSGQGTSSNEYGYAGRNLDLIMDGDASLFKWTDENGVEIESKTITLTETSVPTDYLNVKVNIASSENQNNAQMARRYNEYNPFVRSAKFNDNKVKDCMEFYNCVVFVRESNPDISTHREFKDCEYHFYAIGNVGDSKKTDDTRVNDKSDPRECVVEIKDFNVALAEFPTGNGKNICNPSNWKEGNSAYDLLYAGYEYKDGKFKTFGSKSYEFRYEMKGITEEQREENINAWRDMYKFVVTSTNEEFYSRLKEYFVVDSALYYYLFTERYIMVDNRAKNSFWHYGKVYISENEAEVLGEKSGGFIIDDIQAAINNGYRWDLSFGYDFDTSLGIDNQGKLVLTYGREDSDYYIDGDPSSSYIYRAAESTFFCRIRDLFKSELQAMFVDRESKNAWSASSLISQWDNYQNQFPEELWRLDIQRKYLRTYLGTSIDNSIAGAKEAIFLPQMMNGRKKYQRRMFERNQELYMATKYFGTTATQDQIRLRFNNPESYVVKPDFTLYLKPYSDMYIGYSFYNGHKDNFRAKAGIEYKISYPEGLETADITLIYGASFMQEIGDLSKCYISDNDFTKATRLQSLTIGSDIYGYENSYMKEIKLANNKLLEYLNVRNVTGLSSTIDLSQCNNILELYAQGSSAKGVIFANGGKIKKFYLPAITSLTAKNLNYIEDFNIESYINLQTLVVENTPAIDTHEIVDTTLEIQSLLPEDSQKLTVLRLVGIDWDIENADILEDIILLRGQNSDGGEITQSVLAGIVHIPVIGQYDLYKYQDTWSGLTIDPTTIKPQFTVTFVNDNGTVLDIQHIEQFDNAVNPIRSEDNPDGYIDIPTKESTIQYSYAFDGWDSSLTNIIEDRTIVATYKESLREYTIKYVSKGVTVKTATGLYGDNIVYDGDTPTYTAEEPYAFYLFNRWDKSGFLLEGKDGKNFDENGVKTVNAIFDEFKYTANAFAGRDLTDLDPVEIYAMNKLNLAESVVTNKDSYTIVVGNDIDYNDIDYKLLISEKTHFNGSNHIDTGVQLFDEDKDFVLAIDYEFLSGNPSNAVLAQCFQSNGTNGFKLWYSSASGFTGARLTWGTTSDNVVGINKREIIVIRHKKGENNLTIYKSNLDGNDIQSVELTRTKSTIGDCPLVFGCARADDGYYENHAIGNVNWAKVWFADLGDDVCKNLAMWTHESITLEACGFRKYYLSDNTSKRCSFSLLASHLLGRAKAWNASNTNAGGWAESSLNKSLNERLYNAMPTQIKTLLKKVIVYSSIGQMSSELSSSDCYITIPALIEVDPTQTSEPYNSEGTSISYMVRNEDRKRAFDGGDYNAYWLRSPNVGYANYIWRVESDGQTQGITNANTALGVLIMLSF